MFAHAVRNCNTQASNEFQTFIFYIGLIKLDRQFIRALSKYFSGEDGSTPLTPVRKMGPYVYGYTPQNMSK